MPIDPDVREEHDTLAGIPSPAERLRLFGHDGAMRELSGDHAAGRLHHAWLLQGPRGIGKATLAFQFARRMLIHDRGEAQDAETIERQVANGSHPNLLHVVRPPADRGGFKTQITVDEVRRLHRFFQTTSGSRQWRIAVIDPVDDLNRSAANALLKILEEPPDRCLFLIVNHLPGRLLPTIRSRSRVMRLDALSERTTVDVLEDLGVPGAPADLVAAAAEAKGSVRNAILLLTSGGLEIGRRLDAILAAPEAEWHGIQSLADELTQRGQEAAFDLAVTGLLSRLAADGEAAATEGRLARANDHARLWDEESNRFREGLLYNLDRKQLLMTHFHRRFALRRSAVAH